MNIPTRTDTIEQHLLDIVRALFARDTQVPELLELPVAQLRVLNVLGRGPEERNPAMGELAEALGVALSTATQIVERIEKRGLVRREHGDPDDRRVVRLALTDAGRSLMRQRRLLRHERLEQALACLSAAEQEAIVRALAPLAAAASEIDQNTERKNARADAELPRVLREVA